MALRPQLHYQPPRPERVEAFLHRALEIAAFVEVGIDPAELLAEFNQAAGRIYRAEAILFLLRGGDLPALALEAAVPPAPVVSDLSRDERLDLLARIREAGPGEAGYYMELFDAHAVLPEAACLLFWPPDKRAWRLSRRKLREWQPSDEEIVDLAADWTLSSKSV